MARTSLRIRFGQRVTKLRIQNGWSQVELAQQSGLSKSYIQKIESRRPPDMTVDTIAKLASAFKMSCADLLRGCE